MIGIFDSGLGGLTVVKEIFRRLPGHPIVYLGDTARLPYGTKSPELIKKFSVENSEFLLRNKAEYIVVACHTASVLAGDYLQNKFPDVPIFDVAKTTKKVIASLPRNSRIAVIGTPATIKSGIYQQELLKIHKSPAFVQSCPLFVPLVEEGWIDKKETMEIAKHYLRNFSGGKIDALILACTHYPLLVPIFREILGKEVEIINPAAVLAEDLQKSLAEKSLSSDRKNIAGHKFFITDESYNWQNLSKMILGKMIHVNLINGNTFKSV